MKTESYIRKEYPVDAVKVTAENMEEVREWCDGKIKHKKATAAWPAANYIEVDVQNTKHDRQKMAFVGDWVLKMGVSFKIYTDNAFRNTFQPAKVGTN